MDLIKLNGYIPQSPSTFEVNFADVNGEKTQVEDGTTFIEQVRADVPKIKVGWTNLTQEEVEAITSECAQAIINVDFYYGTMLSAKCTCSDRSLKLKAIDNNNVTYWNLSFTLEG